MAVRKKENAQKKTRSENEKPSKNENQGVSTNKTKFTTAMDETLEHWTWTKILIILSTSTLVLKVRFVTVNCLELPIRSDEIPEQFLMGNKGVHSSEMYRKYLAFLFQIISYSMIASDNSTISI